MSSPKAPKGLSKKRSKLPFSSHTVKLSRQRTPLGLQLDKTRFKFPLLEGKVFLRCGKKKKWTACEASLVDQNLIINTNEGLVSVNKFSSHIDQISSLKEVSSKASQNSIGASNVLHLCNPIHYALLGCHDETKLEYGSLPMDFSISETSTAIENNAPSTSNLCACFITKDMTEVPTPRIRNASFTSFAGIGSRDPVVCETSLDDTPHMIFIKCETDQQLDMWLTGFFTVNIIRREAVITVQKIVRRYLARKEFLRQRQAIQVIQKYARGRLARKQVLPQLSAWVILRRYVLGWIIRGRYKKAIKIHRRRLRIVSEIEETEKNYVDSLTLAKELYLAPLNDFDWISADSITTLSCNIDDLIKFHELFYASIKESFDSFTPHSLFAHVFLKQTAFTDLYSKYITNFDASSDLLVKLNNNSKFKKFHTSVLNNPRSRKLDLRSYLIMPIQRQPRYVLLLKEVLKYTPDEHRDFKNLQTALIKSQNVCETINQHKAIHANREKLHWIETSVIGLPDDALTKNPKRKFLREGFMRKAPTFRGKNLASVGKKKLQRLNRRWFHLLSDVLIYSKPVEGEQFQYRGLIPLFGSTAKLSADDERGLLVISQQSSMFLLCDSQMEKDMWFSDITKAIDSVNNEIMGSKKAKRMSMRPGALKFFAAYANDEPITLSNHLGKSLRQQAAINRQSRMGMNSILMSNGAIPNSPVNIPNPGQRQVGAANPRLTGMASPRKNLFKIYQSGSSSGIRGPKQVPTSTSTSSPIPRLGSQMSNRLPSNKNRGNTPKGLSVPGKLPFGENNDVSEEEVAFIRVPKTKNYRKTIYFDPEVQQGTTFSGFGDLEFSDDDDDDENDATTSQDEDDQNLDDYLDRLNDGKIIYEVMEDDPRFSNSSSSVD